MRSGIWAHKNQSDSYSAGVACYHVCGLGKTPFKAFCVSLLIRRQFSLRLRSRAEWSGVPPKADTGAAESRNKTVNTWKNPVLHCWDIYRKVCSLSPLWYVCNVFYWLNNGVFYSITQLSYATSENWRHKAADLLGGMQAPRLGTRLQINSAEFVGLHAKKLNLLLSVNESRSHTIQANEKEK